MRRRLTKIRVLLIVVSLSIVVVWLALSGLTAQVTVDWSDVHQTIDGFGASSADFLVGLTPAQADFFFTPSGVGLSILRTQIIPDRLTCDTEFHKGGCGEGNGQILDGELRSAQMAVARDATVIATPWSPPGAFKSNGTFNNGGYLLPAHYSDWANEIAQYVVMMAQKGVPIYAVSVQNEPDLSTNYGSCLYTAQQMHDFVPFLYAALQAAGAGKTKIMIAEESGWTFDLVDMAMADPKVASEISIIAAHGYHGSFKPYSSGSARLWQTEDGSQGDVYDGSIRDGIRAARAIHSSLVQADINAWLWWFLSNMPKQGEGFDNSALTDVYGNFPKRAYVTGQWSRFVRPGWSRIGATGSGRVDVTAFKDPKDQSFAIVAVNSSRVPIETTFILKGFTALSVTPWITSSRLSLASQAPVAVNGVRFAYSLPAMSVTTFAGTASRIN